MQRNDSHQDRFQTPAVGRDRASRPGRPRRRSPGIRPTAEVLEGRQLLAVTLTNGIPSGAVGAFTYVVDNGGRGTQSSITANGTSGVVTENSAIFANTNFVDVGSNGGAIALDATTITQQATQNFGGSVVSAGSFPGANGPINWRVTTQLAPGSFQVINTLQFDSNNPFGSVDFINYLDEDLFAFSDDILYAP